MNEAGHLEVAVELLTRLGVAVRYEHLGGAGGGLCTIRGDRVAFVDLDADVATRLERSVAALASCPEVDSLYVPPLLREQIDRARQERT